MMPSQTISVIQHYKTENDTYVTVLPVNTINEVFTDLTNKKTLKMAMEDGSIRNNFIIVNDDNERLALTPDIARINDIVKVSSTKKTYYVKDVTQLDSELGYELLVESVDDIVIGTNLVSGSKNFNFGAIGTVTSETHNGLPVLLSGYDRFELNVPTKDICSISISRQSIEKDTDYTMSFYVKGNVTFRSLFMDGIGSGSLVVSGSNIYGVQTTNKDGIIDHTISSDKWTRYSVTWRTSNNIPNSIKLIPVRLMGSNDTVGNIYICGIKLEKGKVATAYSESPLDISIPPGNNLLSNSSMTMSLDSWDIGDTGATIASVDDTPALFVEGELETNKIIKQSILGKVEPDSIYTISCDVKCSEIVQGSSPMLKMCITGVNPEGNFSYECLDFPTTGEWTKFSSSIQTDSSIETATELTLTIHFCDCTGELYINNLKLEKGAVATDWSPNFIDLQKQINNIASGTGLSEGINQPLLITSEWLDTGIIGDMLTTGTYIVQMSINDGTNNINEIYSGVMSWYDGTSSGDTGSEILLHNTGAMNTNNIYLRTLRTDDGIKLQISSDKDFESECEVGFKFKKLI